MSTLADVARRIPGVAAIENAITGAMATEEDLPIADYDNRSAEDLAAQLRVLAQNDLRKVDLYERKNKNRSTITDKISKLSGPEPLPGYDELSSEAAIAALRDGDEAVAKCVREYERAHKDRSSVIEATGLLAEVS